MELEKAIFPVAGAGGRRLCSLGAQVHGTRRRPCEDAAQPYSRLFVKLYGTPMTVARIFMAYGPSEAAVQRLVPYEMRSLLQGESPRLTSGNRAIDWIHIEDVVDGLIRVALTPGLTGEIVGLGTGHAHPRGRASRRNREG